MNIVYLNGSYLPIEQAKTSVLDRGFLLGDGVYEVISVYHGKTFRPEDHLSRLQENLEAIQISLNFSQTEWLALFNELLQRNQINDTDKAIYLQVTRGADTKREQAFPSPPIEPTVFVMLMDFPRLSYDELKKGHSVITHEDLRWERCHIKSLNLLPNTLLIQEAKQHQAIETILVRDGYALEGTRNNLFIVKQDTIITSPIDQHTLGGITREVILELAKQHNIPTKIQSIPIADLFAADEVWITSSVTEICPITQVDDKAINQGQVGPLWHTMIKLFQDFIAKI